MTKTQNLDQLRAELEALEKQVGAVTTRTAMKTEDDHITCRVCRNLVDLRHAASSCATVPLRARVAAIRSELERSRILARAG